MPQSESIRFIQITKMAYRSGQMTQLPPKQGLMRAAATVRKALRLDMYFNELDDSLLLFTLFGDALYQPRLCMLFPDLMSKLFSTYCIPSCDNRIFESYGDLVLYGIILRWMMESFGPKLTPFQFNAIRRDITSNVALTELGFQLGVCQPLGLRTMENPHNVCSNALESLLGMLYYVYGEQGLPTISEWFLEHPVVSGHLNSVRGKYAPGLEAGCKPVDALALASS
jgi:hypothetical protein